MSAGDPPLFARPIQGVRVWEAVEGERDGPLLRSFAQRSTWPAGKPVRAVCLGARPFHHPRAARRRLHRAPAANCSCGIYALHPYGAGPVGDVLGRLASCDAGVIGTIDAWGAIEVHDAGFRAEHARARRLFVIDRDGEADPLLVERVAAAYGLEVVEVDEIADLAEHFGRLHGLGEDVVDKLLEGRRELVLTPAGGVRTNELVGSGFNLRRGDGSSSPEAGVVTFDVDVTDLDALQSDAFSLAREVALVPEVHRECCILGRFGVWDADRGHKVGMVPVNSMRHVSRWRRTPDTGWPLVVWHWRHRLAGRRIGLRVALPPTPRISLRVGRPPRSVRLQRGDVLF